MKVSDHLREAAPAASDLKVKFPSHALMDLDDKVYKQFDDFHRQHHKNLTPDQDKKFETALRTFVTLLAQLKDAERSLYAKGK